MYLTPEQIAQFEREGVLVLENYLPPEDIQSLVERADHLLRADLDLSSHPLAVFSTDDRAHTADHYFLESADRVHYFFEEHAFQPNQDSEDGAKENQPEQKENRRQLTVPVAEAINKIGHGLHTVDPVFRRITCHDRIKQVLLSLGYRSPVLLQSMLIMKQPRIGGQVNPHQDSTFLHTEPLSALGFWFALEAATLDNGCLWYLPGSHRPTARMRRRFKRYNDNVDHTNSSVGNNKSPTGPTTTAALTEQQQQQPTSNTRLVYMEYDPPEEIHCMPSMDDPRWVPVPVNPGACILIHGSVMHKSDSNWSGKRRLAYAFHAVEGEPAGFAYSPENWLQLKEMEYLYDLTQADKDLKKEEKETLPSFRGTFVQPSLN